MVFGLIFGHFPQGQSVSEENNQKGLAYLKAKPCDVHTTITTSFNLPVHTVFYNRLPFYMIATLTNKAHSFNMHGANILSKLSEMLPLSLPRIITHFNFALSPEEEGLIFQGASFLKTTEKKRTAYILCDSYDIDTLKRLKAKQASEVTQAIYGTMNISSYRAYYQMVKLVLLAASCIAYPAFENIGDVLSGTFTRVGEKRKATDIPAQNAPPGGEQMQVTDEEGDVEEGTKADTLLAMYACPRFAKPITKTVSTFGSSANMPTMPGIYMQFVDTLAVPDEFSIMRFVELMGPCMGSTAIEISSNVELFRQGAGVIKNTIQGKYLSHMCRSVVMAIECQGMPYIVVNGGIYEGTVICGANFSVVMNECVYVPIGHADLHKMVHDSNGHSYALREIGMLCGKDLSKTATIREVDRIVSESALTAENLKIIRQQARLLSFPVKYWSQNAQAVEKVSTLIFNKQEADMNEPMHPDAIGSTDIVLRSLSGFGFTVPVFDLQDGSVTELSHTLPQGYTLAYTLMNLHGATEAWKNMMEKGTIRNNPSTLKAKTTATSFTGNQKEIVWGGLQKFKKGNKGTTSTGSYAGGSGLGTDF